MTRHKGQNYLDKTKYKTAILVWNTQNLTEKSELLTFLISIALTSGNCFQNSSGDLNIEII